ncbi:MAG: hypothetical protein ACI9R3_001008 [Verrucomicrobiales bacterium]|jgi:hypothetical protein
MNIDHNAVSTGGAPCRRVLSALTTLAAAGTLLSLVACGGGGKEEGAATSTAESPGAGPATDESVATTDITAEDPGATPAVMPAPVNDGAMVTTPKPAPAAPEVVREPKIRPRVKSPIDKLPPPEKEMTPPLPRNSRAAAELASAKSEEAGKAYLAFIEATTTAERIKHILRGESLKSKVEEYHTTHEQSDFKVLETQIMGAGRRLDDPTKFVFPYYVATTKNPFGFLVMIYEDNDGMKLAWEQFVLGQDYPLQEFLERKDTTSYEFLGAITQAHIFDPDLSEAEKANLIAVNLDLPRVALPDKPVAYVERASEIGKQLEAALPWGKRQLSRIGLKHDSRGKIYLTSYAKLAHPN